MALTDKEQAILDALQEQLDGTPTLDQRKTRKLISSIIVVLAGLATLITGVILHQVLLGVAGFGIALYGAAYLTPRNLRKTDTRFTYTKTGPATHTKWGEKYKEMNKTFAGKTKLAIGVAALGFAIMIVGTFLANNAFLLIGLMVVFLGPILVYTAHSENDEENF